VTPLSVTALPPVAGDARTGQVVADAMISCPKTHDLGTTADEIRAFFEDDHVHMALIVRTDRRLVTTIERADLSARPPVVALAAELGTLTGRTAGPGQKLKAVTAGLLREQ
jgi:hypothetical protein